MTQYINKSDLVAEIEKRERKLNIDSPHGIGAMVELECLKDIINNLEVKETELPNPRFPHLDDIVEKVFGMGNLDLCEYEEAKQLVLLAKEELLKDLEVKGTELPNLRFPHLDDIVKKIFDTGDLKLEWWEYEEAKQLVLLAKEELLKDLEVKAKELVIDKEGEYTRTGDFIEKACEWLKKNAGKYTWYDESDGESGMVYGFIDAFKNHMKEK